MDYTRVRCAVLRSGRYHRGMRWRPVAGGVVWLLGVAGACGGRSVRHGSGGEAGDNPEGMGVAGGVSGGAGGVGGTGFGATGGMGMGATSGTNLGTAGAGGREATCRVASRVLNVGETMLHADGCTVCACTIDGMDCNSSACAVPDPCADLAKEYELAVSAASWCGVQYGDSTCLFAPAAPDSVTCGCDVLVRGTATTEPIADAYMSLGCPVPEVCNRVCPPPPQLPYRCNQAGFCVGS